MSQEIFRAEAIAHRMQSHFGGEVLAVPPNWARWTYLCVIASVLVAVLFLALASVVRSAQGPAIIRADKRVTITATVAAVVESVHVNAHAHVAKEDPLVRFRSSEHDAELSTLERQFELALARTLAHPADVYTRQTLSALRSQRDLSRLRAQDRLLRAPNPGIVGDVRIRAGQSVLPGEVLLTLVPSDSSYSVLAFLPGHHRPTLHAGVPLRLEMAGYEYAFEQLTVSQIEDELVGLTEVRRMLGAQVADSISVNGPVSVVHASIPDTVFTSGGREYSYFDGMLGTARMQLQSERLLTILLPGLRSFF